MAQTIHTYGIRSQQSFFKYRPSNEFITRAFQRNNIDQNNVHEENLHNCENEVSLTSFEA